MTKKLYVGNLPPNCTKEDLEDLLKKFGGIAECDVISNKNFGFVHMQSETEAQEAVTQLDSTDFMGSILKVQFSTTDVHKSPGVGSKGECFRCGSKGHLSRACPKNVGGGNRGRGGGRGGRGGRGSMGGARRGGGPDMRGRRGPPPPPMRREPPPRGVFRDDFSDDLYYREREERLRRPLSREMEYERRYLDEAYRRMAYPPREYELLYRSRSRSPIRGYDSEYRRPMPAGEREYYERMYGAGAGARSARDPYYDMPLRSRLQGPSRAGPSRY